MKKINLKSLFFLTIVSLINFCYSMEQQESQQNPSTEFTTHFGDHDAMGEVLAQKSLADNVCFYEEYQGKKTVIVRCIPTYLINDEHAQQIINLKQFIQHETVKKFIIQEYKKDKEIIASLINKVFLKEEANSKGSATVWNYNFEENEYLLQDEYAYPSIALNSLLLTPGIRAYAERLYETMQTAAETPAISPKRKAFMQKNPKTSLALATFHGAVGIGTLWRLMASEDFIGSSPFIKSVKISIATIGWIFLGTELMSGLTKKS